MERTAFGFGGVFFETKWAADYADDADKSASSASSMALEQDLRRELQNSRVECVVRRLKCRIRSQNARRSSVVILRRDDRGYANVDVAEVGTVKQIESFEIQLQMSAFAIERNVPAYAQIQSCISRSFDRIPANKRRTVVPGVSIILEIRGGAANRGRVEAAAL